MRSLLGRFKRTVSRSISEQLATLTSVGDGSTLSLDFTTGVLDSRLTFSRASGGTYVGNDGLVYGVDFATSSSLAIGTGSKSVTLTATAGQSRRYEIGQTVYIANGANNMSGAVTAYSADTQVLTINATSTSGSGSFTSWIVGNASARFDYNPTTLAPRGLLIEGTATNLVTNSQNITTGTWTVGGNTTLTANTTEVTDPAGGNTATKIALAANAYCSRAQLVTVLANTAYTFSFWIRGTAGSEQRIFEFGGGDLVSQTSFTYTNTGWTRVQVQFTSASKTQIFVYVCSRSTSAGSSEVLYVWGAQLELGSGSGASSYIPTVGSTVQRTADSCVMSGTNFSPWFNATQGTLLTTWSGTGTTSGRYATINDGSASNQIWAGYSESAIYNGSFQASFGTAGTSNGKVALAYATNDAAWCLNGAAVSTNTSVTLPTGLNQIAVGNSQAGTAAINTSLRSIKYFPTRLANATLQSLTA